MPVENVSSSDDFLVVCFSQEASQPYSQPLTQGALSMSQHQIGPGAPLSQADLSQVTSKFCLCALGRDAGLFSPGL